MHFIYFIKGWMYVKDRKGNQYLLRKMTNGTYTKCKILGNTTLRCSATLIVHFKEVTTLLSKCNIPDYPVQQMQINTFFSFFLAWGLEQINVHKSSLFALKVQLPGILVDDSVQVKVFTLSVLH